MKTLLTRCVLALVCLSGAASAVGPSTAYDLSATYEFRKQLTESGTSFSGDSAGNVCVDKWRDYLPDCESDLDCEALEAEDESIGLICYNGGCTTKGDYLTAYAKCGRRWDKRDGAASVDWGTSYGLKVTMASEGKAVLGGSQHTKSRIKSVLDLTAHVLGFDVALGEMHMLVKNTRSGAAEVSTWFETMLGRELGKKSWRITGSGGGDTDTRDISASHDRTADRCAGIELLVARLKVCGAVRAVFSMDATVETGSGARVEVNAVPTVTVEAEVSVKAEAGLGAVASAKAEGGGTLQLATLRFPLRAEIDGRDSVLKAGFVAQGLSGSVWAKIEGLMDTLWDDTLWDFGAAVPEAHTVEWFMSPDNGLINLIWDADPAM